MAYKREHDPSNADAYPLYNDNVLKVWNWFDNVWNCNDWIVYHRSVKAKYGKPKADETFLAFWNDLATGSSAIDCRSLNAGNRHWHCRLLGIQPVYKKVITRTQDEGICDVCDFDSSAMDGGLQT